MQAARRRWVASPPSSPPRRRVSSSVPRAASRPRSGRLQEQAFVRAVSLGASTLRAETAAMAACALLSCR